MSRLDPGYQHTNASIRKLLGESGYLETEDIPDNIKNLGISLGPLRRSIWVRGTDMIVLREGDYVTPVLIETVEPFNRIDPKTLGVRNPNIQQDGSADE